MQSLGLWHEPEMISHRTMPCLHFLIKYANASYTKERIYVFVGTHLGL